MALYLNNLDKETRRYMLEEFEYDIRTNNLYLSGRLTEAGRHAYPDIFRDNILYGDDSKFAADLKSYISKMELKKKRGGGGYTESSVPHNANETLAEGEFNRIYMRGLCSRVINELSGQLTIYRAKNVNDPRLESQTMIGQIINAEELLSTLRSSQGAFTAIPKPNSGLSIQLVG
ncbi:hypothetical protein P5G60_10250 [Paenibacillus jamilae]|nr:hypothetical protein [Paenibacillus jamilae]